MDVDRLPLALAAWLLTYALHSTVLIASAWLAAVGLARLACRSKTLRDILPGLRERLWKTALVGGLITATVQTGLGLDPWGAQLALSESTVARVEPDAPAPVPAATHTAPIATAPAVTLVRTVEHASRPATIVPAIETAPAPIVPTVLAASEPVAVEPIESESSGVPTWLVVVLAAWAIGVAVGLLRWMFQWNRLLRSLDDRQPIVSGAAHEIFSHLVTRSGARSRATLSLAPQISAPITLGLRRLEICLPPRVTDELQHDEIAALLAHELAHAERSDPQWLMLCRLIEVLCFFQPLNKWCSTWIQDEAEYLCDDWAVVQIGERVPLASCLTEVAGWMMHEDAPRLAPGMAARGTRLSMRVRRLLDEEHEPSTGMRGGWISAFGAASVLAVTLLVPGVAAEARDPATTALDRRTQDLERLFRDEDHTTECAQSAPCAPTPCSEDSPSETDEPALANAFAPPAPTDVADEPVDDATHLDGDSDLESVLDDLDDEIEAMRRELALREHHEAFSARLDELASSVTRLREKQRVLQALIEFAEEIETTTPVTFPNLFSHKD